MDKFNGTVAAVKKARQRPFQRSLLFLFFILGSLLPARADDDFYVHVPDLRVGIDADLVKQVFSSYQGLTYSGIYHNNGTICTTIRADVSLDVSRLQVNSWIRWLDGARGTYLKYHAEPTAKLDCPNFSLGVTCDLSCCPRVGDDGIQIQGYCTFAGLASTRFAFDLGVGPLVSYENLLAMTLPDTQYTSDGFTDFEFGDFVDPNTWQVASDRKTRQIPTLSDVTGWGGRDASAPCSEVDASANDKEAHVSSFTDSNYLLWDLSVGPTRSFSTFQTADLARQSFGAAIPSPTPGQVAFISINSSLLGATSMAGDKTGLFGVLLPIRLFGERDIPVVGKVNWEVYVTKASASFVDSPNGPAVVLNLGTDKARVWGGTIVGTPFVKSISVVSDVTVPTPDQSGKLRIAFNTFDLEIVFGTGTVDIPISVKGIENQLNAGLPDLASISTSIQFDLPQCLDTKVARFEALSNCIAYGGGRNRYMSVSTGTWQHTLHLDLAKSTPVFMNGLIIYPITGTLN